MLCAWALAVWVPGVSQGLLWGDDWAGYVLQALAIRDGSVANELALNTIAMRGSDVPPGPYAYPWGYPLMLAVAGAATGWTLVGVKLIGGAAVVGAVVAAYTALRLRVGMGLAALGTVLACGQPTILFEASIPMSDVPFACLTNVAFALIFAQLVRLDGGARPVMAISIAVALCGAIAFSVRSNGVLLPAAYVGTLALLALLRRCSWRQALAHGVTTCAVTATLCAAYFAFWPDGSLVHMSYVKVDPVNWPARVLGQIKALWYWFPFAALEGSSKLLAVVPTMLLAAVCAIRRPWDTAAIAIFAGLQVGLLVLFPYDGGARYYTPVQLPFFALLTIGAAEAGKLALQRWPALASSPRYAAAAVLVATAIAAVGFTRVTHALHVDRMQLGDDAPLAPAATDLASFLDRRASVDARIGFFRPRALRLLSGRVAFTIREVSSLERVDWYVWTRRSRDELRQVPLDALTDPRSGFIKVYETGPFVVFARESSSSGPRSEQRTLRARGLLR